MTVQRGSTAKLVVIKEVTPGTTPATPTMLEMPVVSFSPNSNIGVLKSEQIRSHPFTDKMLDGRFMHEFGIDFELQDGVHDTLLETFLGSTISAKAIKFTDALKTLSMEEQIGGGSSLFNHFLGAYLNRLSISAAASDTAPVRVSTSGTALTATLDDSATIATAVTAAANNDPFIFADASLTANATAVPVVSGTINLERVVDPLMLWNSRNPREFVPGAATASGSIVVPYDDAVQANILEAFTDAALVFKFANKGVTTYRQFTFPKTKFVRLGRTVDGRGGRMQQIDWEAYYDSTSATICTMATQ